MSRRTRWRGLTVHRGPGSARQRAIALLLSALAFGGPAAGCRTMQSPPPRRPSVPSAPPNETVRGGERDDVEPVRYVPSSEATPPPDPPPMAGPVEPGTPSSLA